MKVMESSRTFLREITAEDSCFFLELVNTEGWLKYIGDRNLRTEEESRKYLQDRVIRHYSQHGFGMWLVIEKYERKSLGICGLVCREGLDHPDVGFAFSPRFQG